MEKKTLLRVKKTEVNDGEEDPIIKNRGKGRFKALIPAEDYNPGLIAQFATKTKFVKRRGKEYVKVKGKFDPNRIPKKEDNDINPIKETIL